MNLLSIAPKRLCEILHTDPERGLTHAAARQNRKEFGKNTAQPALFTPKSVFKSLCSNVLFCMFFVLCVFSLFTENRTVALVCLSAGGLSYLAFYLFCYARSRPLSAELESKAHRYTVVREGENVALDIGEIVPGDLLILRRGESVPCDGIVLHALNLKVCQAQIDFRASRTKYSWDEAKESGRDKESAILYCGSILTSGSAVVLVCNTGKNIRKTSLSERQKHDLPRPLKIVSDYTRRLSLALLIVSTLLFVAGTLIGVDAFDNFFLLCTIAVSVLPELADGLCRLAMILPLEKLRRAGCLVQNPAALDTLASTDRILIDSAAYFLDSDIQPANYFFANCPRSVREVSEGLFTILSYCRLCCEDAPKKKQQMWYGNRSVDAAICRTAPGFGIDREYLEHSFLTISKSPYDEARGFSTALVLQNEKCYQLVRGRASDVLARCTHMLQEKRSVVLSDAGKARLYQTADAIAAGGEVVVAVARRYYRSAPESLDPNEATYLTFVGFLSFYTPLRAESAEAVAACRRDGVHVLLCTDNDPDASLGIAKNMEFFSPEEDTGVLTGEKARRMDEFTLREAFANHKVFCGLSPAGKRGVILAHKNEGHTVISCVHAMSDAPAQEAADLSVVSARETCPGLLQNADIVLTADRFELLPEAMKTARAIFFNAFRILRFAIFLMATLFSSALLSILFCKNVSLLTPLPVLLIGLVCGIGLSILLTQDKPRTTPLVPLSEKHYSKTRFVHLLTYGLITGGVGALSVFGTYRISLLFCRPAEALSASTIALFVTILFAFFGARKSRRIFEAEFEQNLKIYLAFPITALILFILLGISTVQIHLGLLTPPFAAVIIAVFLSLIPVLVGEVFKTVKLRHKRK